MLRPQAPQHSAPSSGSCRLEIVRVGSSSVGWLGRSSKKQPAGISRHLASCSVGEAAKVQGNPACFLLALSLIKTLELVASSHPCCPNPYKSQGKSWRPASVVGTSPG